MNVHVVLVRTEYSANMGAAARALANMGGGRLILLDPRCPQDEKAQQMAAGAQEVWRSRVSYANWEEFYAREGDGVRIALSRRGGRRRKVFSLDEQTQKLVLDPPTNLYLIFGPEADGLDMSDLAFVNYTCHLPVFGEFASFNLAQAVLLALFMVRQKIPPASLPEQTTGKEDEAVQPLYFPDGLIREWLTAMGFNIQARKSSAYLTLKRLFLQNLPTKHEIQVLEAILQQNIRKLKSVGLATEQLADDLGDVTREQI